MWELDHKESWASKNWCFWTEVLEKILESPLDCRETKPVTLKGNLPEYYWKGWCWSTNNLTTWCRLTHWIQSWCWERLRAGGEGGNRGCDDWMASLTQWMWVWANSGRQWRTGKPDLLQFMVSPSRAWLSDWTTTTTRDCHIECNKSDQRGEILCDICYTWDLKRNDTNELIHKTARDSQTQRTKLYLLWVGGGRVGEGIVREFGINTYTLLLLLLSHFSHVQLCATP